MLGEEVGGAFIVGLRYGNGELSEKNAGKRKVYWQGPSVGFDFGGNAAKSMTLVYHIKSSAIPASAAVSISWRASA
ncbi:MAG: EipA family protein [Pseudomonadota bacterium]|nr:EipA family protein [Pseudomonadota bacterium]